MVVEDYVTMAGQVGIGDKAHIGTRVVLGGQAGVLPSRKVAPNQAYWGTPARGAPRVPAQARVISTACRTRSTELKDLKKRLTKLENR